MTPQKTLNIHIYHDGTWELRNIWELEKKLGRKIALDYGALPTVLAAKALAALGLTTAASIETYYYGSYPSNYDPIDSGLVGRQLAFYTILRKKYRYNIETFAINFEKNRVPKAARDAMPTEKHFVPHEKEVDTAMATSIVTASLLKSCDIAILICGDRDFLPAITRARKNGTKVLVASLAGHCTREFNSQTVDGEIIWLDHLLGSIERTRDCFCSSTRHPATLPRGFRVSVALSELEASVCPLCASLDKALKHRATTTIATPAAVQPVIPAPQAQHAPLLGTVTKIWPGRGYGFVTSQNTNRNYFFHSSQISGWEALKVGYRLFFEVGSEPYGNKAGKCFRIRPALQAA